MKLGQVTDSVVRMRSPALYFLRSRFHKDQYALDFKSVWEDWSGVSLVKRMPLTDFILILKRIGR